MAAIDAFRIINTDLDVRGVEEPQRRVELGHPGG